MTAFNHKNETTLLIDIITSSPDSLVILFYFSELNIVTKFQRDHS